MLNHLGSAQNGSTVLTHYIVISVYTSLMTSFSECYASVAYNLAKHLAPLRLSLTIVLVAQETHVHCTVLNVVRQYFSTTRMHAT